MNLTKHLAKLLNLTSNDINRVLFAWTLKLFINIGKILGWTLMLATTITYFSIKTLPTVIIINAIFIIIGMFLFSVLIEKLNSNKLIILSTISSIIFLTLSSIFISNKFLFLLFLLIAFSLFMSQLDILTSNYLEEYFTPQEGERVFPIIDSAKTIGGILAGILLITFGFYILLQKLIWLFIIFLISFLFVFLLVKPPLP